MLLILLFASTLARATPPPIPADFFRIYYYNDNNLQKKINIAQKLCANSDSVDPATQIMCLYSQNQNLNQSCYQDRCSLYISFKTMKEFIETIHASQKACYYGKKDNIVTQIMCAYAKASKEHLDWLLSINPHCFKKSYISQTIKEINYCINDGYQGFNHP